MQPITAHRPDVDKFILLDRRPRLRFDLGHQAGQRGIVFQRNDAHPREAGVGVAHLLQHVWRLIHLDMQVGGLGERHVADHGCVGDPG